MFRQQIWFGMAYLWGGEAVNEVEGGSKVLTMLDIPGLLELIFYQAGISNF